MNTLEIVEAILPLDFRNKTLKECMDAIPTEVVNGILESPDRKTLCLMLGISIKLNRGPINLEADVNEVLMVVPVQSAKYLEELGIRASMCLRGTWCERRGLATVQWPATITDKASPRIAVYPGGEKEAIAAFQGDDAPLVLLGDPIGTFRRNDPRYS